MKKCKPFFFLVAVFACFFGTVSAKEEKWENYCKAYFAPHVELVDSLIELIEAEQQSIKIAVSNLTNRKIVSALIDAQERGVNVQVIVDNSSFKSKFPLEKIAHSGIPVYVFDPTVVTEIDNLKPGSITSKKKHKPHMRSKFCLFGKNKKDQSLIWTGSLNFTHKSNRLSKENVVVISIENVVGKYIKEFESIKGSDCKSYEQYKLVMNKNKKKMIAGK